MNETPPENPALAKYRPYVLGGVLGVALLYFGGEWVVENLLQGPIEKARKTQERLNEEIDKRKAGLKRARKDAKRLDRWRSQSLPSDTEVARSLYQAWLLELVEHVKLGNPSVNSGEPLARKGLYHTISFSLRGRGTLQQWTEFLFLFYQTDLLHQIRSLNIIPLSAADQLDVSVSIEAMVLPEEEPEAEEGATAEERQAMVFEDFRQRASRQSGRLATLTLASLKPSPVNEDDAVDGDASENRDRSDPADHFYLTGIGRSKDDDVPLAEFTLRATDEKTAKKKAADKKFKVQEEKSLRVGWLQATVGKIDPTGGAVTLASRGENWVLPLGRRLNEASLPARLADYDPIVRRNLFGVGGSPDPTSHAYLTSINSVNGEPEAWFTLRASGETKKLREGASFEIGQVSGTIVEIEGSEVILESDGERWLLTLGDSLVDASALPPEL